MTDSVVSELVVLALLLAVNCRMFFARRDRRDVFVVLAPVSLVLCVLVFFAWGITVPSVTVFALSVLTCLLNIHGIWRLFSGLLTDYYSLPMCVLSCLVLLLTAAATTGIVILRPVPVPLRELAVREEIRLLCGSHVTGYTERSSAFEPYDAKIIRFTPETAEAENPLVIFVADPRQTADRLAPIAAQLAFLGYEVVLGDFAASPLGPALDRLSAVLDPDSFLEEQRHFPQIAAARYGALADFFAPGNNRPVFIAGDGLCRDALPKAAEQKRGRISGWFCINGPSSGGTRFPVDGWRDGFGAVQESAPWLEWILRKGGSILDCRDTTRFNSVLAASQMDKFFSSLQKDAPPASLPLTE